jgi:hypothetical protein
MTRAAEDRDIDRLFSFMLPNDRGSIIQSGNLLADPRRGPGHRQAELSGRRRHQVPLEAATRHRDLPTTALLVCDGESEIRTAQDSPATFVTPFAQTVLFVLTDGKWKALHAHMSTVPR